jgi:hypothetical protein
MLLATSTRKSNRSLLRSRVDRSLCDHPKRNSVCPLFTSKSRSLLGAPSVRPSAWIAIRKPSKLTRSRYVAYLSSGWTEPAFGEAPPRSG